MSLNVTLDIVYYLCCIFARVVTLSYYRYVYKKLWLIDEIGAYIKLEYRNKKIGIELLKIVNDYCKDFNVPYIHVDFETANLYGNKFWKKYFTPMLLSMRRPINKDINDR